MTNSAANTDDEILKLLADDNPKSISLMYHAHHTAVTRRIRNIVPHPQDAEDIVQELFLAIWEKRRTLKLVSPIRGYLLAAAHNRALNFIVRKTRSKLVYMDTMSMVLFDKLAYEPSSHRRMLAMRIKAAIRMLPERTRIVYMLSRSFEMTNVEIAHQLNISVKAVEKHITKALKLLRQFLRLSMVVLFMYLDC